MCFEQVNITENVHLYVWYQGTEIWLRLHVGLRIPSGQESKSTPVMTTNPSLLSCRRFRLRIIRRYREVDALWTICSTKSKQKCVTQVTLTSVTLLMGR